MLNTLIRRAEGGGGDRGSTVVKVLCCVINRKDAGSIPAGVIGIFY